MIKSPSGYPVQSPYVSLVNRQAEIMMRIAEWTHRQNQLLRARYCGPSRECVPLSRVVPLRPALCDQEYNPVQPKEHGRPNDPERDHDVADPAVCKHSKLKGHGLAPMTRRK
jgi:hypothetical protein